MKSRKHSHVPPVSRKREPGGKAVRMSEIMRLFYKYGVDAIPVLDKKGKLQGLLDKKLVLHDADDAQSIDKRSTSPWINTCFPRGSGILVPGLRITG